MTEFADKSIGATLRERRLELGISLDEVATRTRIRKSYLEALEAEQFDAFPGDTYLKGYLKGYSECLGLDPQGMLRSLAGVHAITPSPATVEPAPRPTRPFLRRGAIPLLLGFVVLLIVGWWLFGRTSAQPGPEMQPSAAVNQDQGAQLPPGEGAASPIEPSAQAPQTTASSGDQPAAQSVSAHPRTEASLPVSATSTGPENATSPQGAAIADPVVPPGATGVLRLQASGPGPLEVTIDGRPAQRYTLQANTILSWKVTRTVRVYLGNPGNVRMWLSGREIDLAGRNHIVLQSAQEPGQ